MAYINYTKEQEDPYYWRKKVLSLRAQNEVDGHDKKESSDFSWAQEIAKENINDQHNHQNQTALNMLWYKDGMQVNLNSDTAMAESLRAIMSHIKEIAAQEKEDGRDSIFKGITDDPGTIMEDAQELKLKALAVSALAEADGHAPEAKKILDQAGNDKRKRAESKSMQIIKPLPPTTNGR